jgi:hypothetical protein
LIVTALAQACAEQIDDFELEASLATPDQWRSQLRAMPDSATGQ